MSNLYHEFLNTKNKFGNNYGFKPLWMPFFLFDFQAFLVDWTLRKGKAAVFADCGLGKTPIELVWAANVLEKTNKPVLILAPLAVSHQMIREGIKFGVEVNLCKDGRLRKGINVTNYEKLGKFDPGVLAGLVCDESSILKNTDGKTRKAITSFMARIPYRLLATATPSPNDFMELGTSSEALGEMTRSQMLGMFFTHDSDETQQWTLKGHGRKEFWKWLCCWSRGLRKPSDLGFDDAKFELLPIVTQQHLLPSKIPAEGLGVFKLARTLHDQRKERRLTMLDRCEKVAEIVATKKGSVVWCHLNEEGDLLEKLIPGCVQVSGSDSDDEKEEKLTAFTTDQVKRIITKPKIGGFGLNWQHCAHMTFFPSHSWEQYYQAVRRCWRFGQKSPVQVDIVTTEAESSVSANMRRKEKQMEELFSQLVGEMAAYQNPNKNGYYAELKIKLPEWLNKNKK